MLVEHHLDAEEQREGRNGRPQHVRRVAHLHDTEWSTLPRPGQVQQGDQD
jgi:hypothetical protein